MIHATRSFAPGSTLESQPTTRRHCLCSSLRYGTMQRRGVGPSPSPTYGDWTCRIIVRLLLPVLTLVCGPCRGTRLSSKRCPMSILIRWAFPDCRYLRMLNSSEPPWYGTRMPGGVTGKACEGLPMSILKPFGGLQQLRQIVQISRHGRVLLAEGSLVDLQRSPHQRLRLPEPVGVLQQSR